MRLFRARHRRAFAACINTCRVICRAGACSEPPKLAFARFGEPHVLPPPAGRMTCGKIQHCFKTAGVNPRPTACHRFTIAQTQWKAKQDPSNQKRRTLPPFFTYSRNSKIPCRPRFWEAPYPLPPLLQPTSCRVPFCQRNK